MSSNSEVAGNPNSGSRKQVMTRTWFDMGRLFWPIFTLLCLLLVLPLWQVKYLPLGDLAQHAAQMQMLLNADDYAAQGYAFNWFTPYILGYLPVLLLAQIMPLLVALKIVLSLVVLGVPLATLALIRAINGDRWWVLGSFLAAYSYSFYWGFYSYVVATPLVILMVAFAVWFARRPINLVWGTVAAVLSLLVFSAHALAWIAAISVAFVVLWGQGGFMAAIQRLLVFLVPMPLILIWVSDGSAADGHLLETLFRQVTETVTFIVHHFNERTANGVHWLRLKEFFALALGRPVLWDYIILGGAALVIPVLMGAKLSRNWKGFLPLISVFALFMTIPYFLHGTAYIYYRFAVFMLPFSLFLYSKGAFVTTRQGWSKLLLTALVFALLWQNMKLFTDFRSQDEQFSEFVSQLENIQPDKRILYLNYKPDSGFRLSSAYAHYGFWLQVERDGTVHPAFSHYVFAKNVPVRYTGSRPIPQAVSHGPDFDWEKHAGHGYDYFLLRTDEVPSTFDDKNLAMVLQHGEYILLKNIERNKFQ